MMHSIVEKLRGIHINRTALRKKTELIISNTIIYILLFEFIFVFFRPFIFMIINSLKFNLDFTDINRDWILSGLNFENYEIAFDVLDYGKTVINNIIIIVLSTLGHVLSCSFIAYGISRFNFFGKSIVFSLVILSILVPPQILQMPLYIQFVQMGWLKTLLPIIVPTFFGFGLKGGVFIFIFIQFFKGLPKSYEESAKIEGCNSLKVYYKIMLPLSKTSILVVSTLSAIWHWNDIFEPMAYLKGSTQVLTQMLSSMKDYNYWVMTPIGTHVSPVQLAACVLIVLPILLAFIVVQKRFMAGIEFSGLAN